MESMEIDSSSESVLRPNSIWVHGVDNLSTSDIKDYVKRYVESDFKIEWINDTSLNVVFESDEEATEALKELTLNSDNEFQPNEEREAKKFQADKPEVLLTLRISNLSDKKVKNAAAYSRYYLYNPPKHEFEKRRPRSKNNRREGDNYREREPVAFRRSRDEDKEDDGIDLFPEKASNISKRRSNSDNDNEIIRGKDEDSIEIDDSNISSTNDESLSSRLGNKLDNDISIEEDETPKSSNLLDRIGSKFKEKNLATDDLFG